MNHVSCRQTAAGGDDTPARFDRPLRDGLVFDNLPALRFDGSRDAGAHPKGVIGGVDDGLSGLAGDVALDDLDVELRDAERTQVRYNCF